GKDDPSTRWQAGRAHLNLGIIQQLLGSAGEAEPEYHQAIDLLTRLADDSPDRLAYRRDLASAHYRLGVLLSETRRLAAAEREHRRALTLQRSLCAEGEPLPPHPQPLSPEAGARGERS